jgi:DNA-binding transcriptional ArsR family regulator
MRIEEQLKTSILLFLYDPEKIYTQMQKLFTICEKIVDRVYNYFASDIQNFYEKYKEEVLVSALELCGIDVSLIKQYELSLSLINQSDEITYDRGDTTILILGLCFEQAAYHRINKRIDIDWRGLGRVLSDEKRVKIIELLRNQELYITEIAKAMGMSVTAVWYHLDILNSEKALILRTEGRKVYYRLNDEFFNALAHYSAEYCKMLVSK